MLRRFLVFSLLLSALFAAVPALAGEQPVADVVELSGPMDQRLIDFAVEAIDQSPAQFVVLQIDSAGVASGNLSKLIDSVHDAVLPVVAYVGPRPARAYGGAALAAAAAHVGAAAPGVSVGLLEPAVVRNGEVLALDAELAPLSDRRIEVTEPVPGIIDEVVPTIGQLIVGLDGRRVDVGGVPVELATARVETLPDGGTTLVPAGEVRFVRPGLWTRFLRLGATPEGALLFLVVGLAAAAFEFYAAGAGVSAAVAGLALFMSGYGLAVLPVRWWAVALVIAGVGLYLGDFQQNQLGWRSISGTTSLVVGGIMFVDAGDQFGTKLWAVVLIVVGAAAFFGFALTTVVRARFSTRTIGREHLVGRQAVARTPLTPEGYVDLDGAQWRARSTRAAAIEAGDAVEVVQVSGITLDVDPA